MARYTSDTPLVSQNSLRTWRISPYSGSSVNWARLLRYPSVSVFSDPAAVCSLYYAAFLLFKNKNGQSPLYRS